jgi:urease accessory protein
VAVVAGRSSVVRMAARAPIKLLAPRDHSPAARLVVSNFGGGIVAGDALRLGLDVGEEAVALLTTQSSTKVYRSDGPLAQQRVRAAVGRGGLLAVVGDPVTCFAAARYRQEQRFELAETASLVVVDLLTSGRWACGERWAFSHYRSAIDVAVGGSDVLRDRLLLDPADGPLDSPMRCGRFECLATLLLIGPAVADVAAGVLETVGRMPVQRRAGVLASAGPTGGGGALARLAGPSAEACVEQARSLCRGLAAAIGADPWGRKW